MSHDAFEAAQGLLEYVRRAAAATGPGTLSLAPIDKLRSEENERFALVGAREPELRRRVLMLQARHALLDRPIEVDTDAVIARAAADRSGEEGRSSEEGRSGEADAAEAAQAAPMAFAPPADLAEPDPADLITTPPPEAPSRPLSRDDVPVFVPLDEVAEYTQELEAPLDSFVDDEVPLSQEGGEADDGLVVGDDLDLWETDTIEFDDGTDLESAAQAGDQVAAEAVEAVAAEAVEDAVAAADGDEEHTELVSADQIAALLARDSVPPPDEGEDVDAAQQGASEDEESTVLMDAEQARRELEALLHGGHRAQEAADAATDEEAIDEVPIADAEEEPVAEAQGAEVTAPRVARGREEDDLDDDSEVPGSEEYDVQQAMSEDMPLEDIANLPQVGFEDIDEEEGVSDLGDDLMLEDDEGEIESSAPTLGGQAPTVAERGPVAPPPVTVRRESIPDMLPPAPAQVDNSLLDDYGQAILPTIRDHRENRPAAAAVQINPDGSALALGADADYLDEVKVALGPADDDDMHDDGDFGLSVSKIVREYEEVDDDDDGPAIATAALPTLDPEPVLTGRPTPIPIDHETSAPMEDLAPEVVQQLLSVAYDNEEQGDLEAAASAYTELLERDPYHVEAYLGRGRCHLDLGDYAAAMSDFQKAEDLDGDGPEPLVAMGELFFARKDYGRAIEFFDHAVELDPSHAMARCRRGISYYYKKSYRQAFLDLQKAYTLDPDIPNIRKYVQMAIKKLERSGEA